MTVNDLVEKLQQLQRDGSGERTVRFVYDYGNRSHTKVAQAVSRIEEEFVRQNDYVNNMALVDEDQDIAGGDELAVVLT